MKKIVLLTILLAACGSEDNCYQNFYQNVANFAVNPDKTTPTGIKIDSGGFEIDIAKLEERIAKIESCILDIFARYPKLNDQERQDWQCLKGGFDPDEKLKRGCLAIKIIPPIHSKCSEWQFLPVEAPKELCLAKGVNPTPECPCRWKTAIQNENIIITPPALYLWEIGRMMTSCNNVWASPFAECLSF